MKEIDASKKKNKVKDAQKNQTDSLKTTEGNNWKNDKKIFQVNFGVSRLILNQRSDILQHSQNRPTGGRWLKF